MDITFYYARQPSDLAHLKEQCTAWLPESQPPESQDIWQPGQFIATCDLSYLFRLRDLIRAKAFAPDKAIWIEVRNQTSTAYVFDKTGKITNFFRIV